MEGAGLPPLAGMRRVSGDAARSLIEAQLTAHGDGILSVLGRYRLADAFPAWHGTIRAVEEFINIPWFGIDDPRVEARPCSMPLDHRLMSNIEPIFRAVREILSPRFEAGVVSRYLQTMLQTAAIASAFKMHGQVAFGPGITLDTVGAAVDYFQSRRRHMVSLLYTMPFACGGTSMPIWTKPGAPMAKSPELFTRENEDPADVDHAPPHERYQSRADATIVSLCPSTRVIF